MSRFPTGAHLASWAGRTPLDNSSGSGWQPASLAVITGALTWLILTGRGELAARPRE